MAEIPCLQVLCQQDPLLALREVVERRTKRRCCDAATVGQQCNGSSPGPQEGQEERNGRVLRVMKQ